MIQNYTQKRYADLNELSESEAEPDLDASLGSRA
jgi:hypothetical protein